MRLRRLGQLAAGGLVAVLVLSVLVGQLLGQPILLSYVATGSMAPTLHPGDGFVAVPAAIAGEPEVGDVVVFQAETLHGGGLTTHRIVGERGGGYVTKGDANPFTDQDGGEPPVTEARIVAHALQVNGEVLVIPNLGVPAMVLGSAVTGGQRFLASLFGTRAFLGTQGLAFLLFALGIGAYGYETYRERNRGPRRETDRSVRRPGEIDARVVVALLTLLVVSGVTAAMVVPSGAQELTFVSSSTDSPRQNVVRAGTTDEVTYSFRNSGVVPAVVFLAGDGENLTVERDELYVPGGAQANVSATLQAPEETGVFSYTLTRHWYLAVLPQGTIRALHAVHPLVPVLVIDGLVGTGVALIGVAVLGTGRLRVRESGVTFSNRVRGWLREWR